MEVMTVMYRHFNTSVYLFFIPEPYHVVHYFNWYFTLNCEACKIQAL